MDKELDLMRLTTTANLLSQHSKIHNLSVAMTVSVLLASLLLVGLGSLDLPGLSGMLLIVLLGVIEMVLAVRVGFDTALLRQLVHSNNFTSADLNGLDQALVWLKLMPADKSVRSLEPRLQGCLRLFKQQVACCMLQLVVLLSVIACLAWLRQ